MKGRHLREAPPKAEQLAPTKAATGSIGTGLAPMLTVADVAAFLELSERHVRREIKGKRLAAHRFGRLLRIAPADLEAYIAARRRGPR